MRVSVTDAKAQLTDLVRRAEAGDDVVLTRHGHDAVRLVPVKPLRDPQSRREFLEALSLSASEKATPGPEPEALYGEDGLPA